MRSVFRVAALAALLCIALPAGADQNLRGRVHAPAHENFKGFRLPTYAGACTAVTGQQEGDGCWNSTGDTWNVFNGSTFSTFSPTSATQTELDQLIGSTGLVKTKRVALAATGSAGGAAAWTPGVRKFIHRVRLDITTKVTAGGTTIDCGIATNATTLSDTSIDGADSSAAAVYLDSTDGTDNGTNGIAKSQPISSTQAVTCSSVGGTALTGIVGYVYIDYSDV